MFRYLEDTGGENHNKDGLGEYDGRAVTNRNQTGKSEQNLHKKSMLIQDHFKFIMIGSCVIHNLKLTKRSNMRVPPKIVLITIRKVIFPS